MPTIRESYTAPSRRPIARVAIAVGFVVAAYLYAVHIEARDKAGAAAAAHALSRVSRDPHGALAEAVSARSALGDRPALARATWAALMAGGGRHGSGAMVRRTFPYTPRSADFKLMFGSEGRFLAAIDGNTITLWNVETGQHVLTTQGGDRFIGYWRIGARHFGLFASYQYYDLVNSVIELPDGYRYAQPGKDALSAVAPDGDWAYRVPEKAPGRTDYPIKLINLHTGEKREVDVNSGGDGAVAVNSDATRIANKIGVFDSHAIGLWDARKRTQIALIPGMSNNPLYFSKATGTLVVGSGPLAGAKRTMNFFDSNTGKALFYVSAPGETGARAIADDPKGIWFAVQTAGMIKLYRGMNSPALWVIAQNEVSPAPATSH